MTVEVLTLDALDALERRLVGVKEKRQIRRSMAAWARYKGFEPAAHHLLIMNELERFIASDEHDVLLLHAPPGCAKSTYISALFPSWYFANFPQNNILFATHSDDFAHRWGRRVRNDVTNEPGNSGTYASGGSVLTSTELVVATPAATQINYDAADLSWTGTTITARGAVTFRNVGTAATDEIIVANSFASDVSTSGGTFTLSWHVNGLFFIDYA